MSAFFPHVGSTAARRRQPERATLRGAAAPSWVLVLVLAALPALGACTLPAQPDPSSSLEGASPLGEEESPSLADTMSEGADDAEPDAPAPPEAGTLTDDGREIVRVTLGEYAITSTHTTFQTGVPYRLVIEDTGVISHELRILPRGESVQAMAEMGHEHGTMDHDHGGQMLHVGGETLQPGVMVERDLVFAEPGEMEMACHLPGHLEAGMLLDVDVVGDPVDLTITAADITYDPDTMSDMPCHAMNTTIMGDCSPADILRITQEILEEANGGMVAPSAGDGMEMDDHAHDEGMDEDHGHDEHEEEEEHEDEGEEHDG